MISAMGAKSAKSPLLCAHRMLDLFVDFHDDVLVARRHGLLLSLGEFDETLQVPLNFGGKLQLPMADRLALFQRRSFIW
jgi:hypothetical protein